MQPYGFNCLRTEKQGNKKEFVLLVQSWIFPLFYN
jgi:hypothetical protein